jgi:hypothetical protein
VVRAARVDVVVEHAKVVAVARVRRHPGEPVFAKRVHIRCIRRESASSAVVGA